MAATTTAVHRTAADLLNLLFSVATGSVMPVAATILAMEPRRNSHKGVPAAHKPLNRLTKMVVLVAGLVLIGGSAVGGIAFAASRSSDTPLVHPQTTSSADDQGKSGEDNGNGQDSDHSTAKPTTSATCAKDNDTDDTATTGEHEGTPTASKNPEADDVHRTSGVTPTATGTHHPEATEGPEATETKDADDSGTGSSCERDD
jgi:cytoskeletal protein RodZ